MSKHSRVKHTYNFYRKRRNDPNWHDDYIYVRDKRIIKFLLVIVLLLFLGLGYIFFYGGNSQEPNFEESAGVVNSDSSSSNKISNSESIETDNDSDPDEYQVTTKIGKYTVSTEEINANQTYSVNIHAGSNSAEPKYRVIKFELDDVTGDGIFTDLGNSSIPSNESQTAHYQQIKTKKIEVINADYETRTVKVNTAVINNSGKVISFVFKRSNGNVSVTWKNDSGLIEAIPTDEISFN